MSRFHPVNISREIGLWSQNFFSDVTQNLRRDISSCANDNTGEKNRRF